MQQPQPPAICDTCGNVFTVPNIFGPGLRIGIQNVGVGPCPYCGGTGKIPDGFYEFTGDAVNIFSTWSAERLRQLATALESARATANQQAAIEALQQESDLADLVHRLSPLRDASAFWGFVAVLVMAITFAISQTQAGTNVTVKPETIIEKVIAQPNPVTPTAKKKPPPPPRKQRKAKQQKRHK